MKKILVLTVALVLAFSAVAFAETSIKTTGKVVLSLENDGDTTTYANTYRLELNGTVSENAGFQLRFENGTITDTITPESAPGADDAVTADLAVGAQLKRANYWVNIPGAGKVTAGLQWQNFSALDWFSTNLNMAYAGVSFAPALPAGKAVVFWAPNAAGDTTKDVIGGQASFDVAGATIYGGAKKASADDEATLAFGASYAVIPDQFTVYAEYNKNGADFVGLENGDDIAVGANFKTGGFDLYGEYQLDAKKFAFDAYKTFGGVEFELSYEKANADANGTLGLGTTLYF